jgi:chromate transporter
VPGALVATLGMFLPSFLLLLGLFQVYDRVKQHVMVESFFRGVRPAVIGFLLSAAVFIAVNTCADWRFALFGFVVLAATIRFRIDPIFLIAAGAVFGLVVGCFW